MSRVPGAKLQSESEGSMYPLLEPTRTWHLIVIGQVLQVNTSLGRANPQGKRDMDCGIPSGLPARLCVVFCSGMEVCLLRFGAFGVADEVVNP